MTEPTESAPGDAVVAAPADSTSTEPATASAPDVAAPAPVAPAVPAPHPSGDDAAPLVAQLPQERVGRGLLFALPVLPLGVVAWVVVWQLGFISAIVAFGVVALAAYLYRLGSGGRIGVLGVVSIVGLTIVTLVAAFFAGFAADLAAFLGAPFPGSLTDPEFLDLFALNVFDNPELWAEYTPSILIALALAALGAFSVIRQLTREARAAR